MRILKLGSLIVLLISVCAEADNVTRVSIPLKGSAEGGTLYLGDVLNRNASFAYIETVPGESAEAVARSLAVAISYTDALYDWPEGTDREAVVSHIVSGSTLRLWGLPGTYFLAGTETGLGIPEPPLFLSATYYTNKDALVFTWANSAPDYDSLVLRLRWDKYGSWHRQQLRGNSTSCIIDRGRVPVDLDDVDCWIVAIRDGIPSAPAGIHVSSQGAVQDELFGIPFTKGVGPNWRSWSSSKLDSRRCVLSTERAGLAFAPNKRYNPAKEPSRKPFVQVLKTPAGGGMVGVYRKFLGVAPGHTYRLTTRVNTLDMDPNDSSWSYSIHMTCGGPQDADLDEAHFSGAKALPNGESGPGAGRVAGYHRRTTGHKYARDSVEFTLPSGSDSITVWVRYGSTKETTGVSLDWIQLEDLTLKSGGA
jgi:hypothetical protein